MNKWGLFCADIIKKFIIHWYILYIVQQKKIAFQETSKGKLTLY